MINMNVQNIKTSDLVPYVRNQKKHDKKQIDNVAESIKQFGMVQPIVVDKDNNVIIGHCRLLACQKLKIEEVPVVKLEELTPEQANKLRLLDNKLNESDWDFDILKEDIPELDFTGFDIDWELPESITEETKEVVEDEVPEKVETRCKKGDIWKLGNHRLICGDSTDITVIDRLMDGAKADMVFTDPPYGVAYQGGMKIENGKIESNGKKQIKNDDLDYENLYQFLYDVFTNIKVHTKEKSALYVFYSHNRSREFLNAFYDAGLKQRSIIVWHKTSGGFGDFMAQYMSAYEPCIYGSNGKTVNWYGATNEKTVWDIDKEKKCDLHPTMKPLELVGRAIKNSSKTDDLVLDCFGGSGSTLIACEQLNRKCYMCELDPYYCDVIINRYMNLTGKDDVYLINQDGTKTKYTEINKEGINENN